MEKLSFVVDGKKHQTTFYSIGGGFVVKEALINAKENDIIINVMEDLEPGDMIVMPCTVYHGVYPQGPGKRTTINIDFNYAGKEN